MPQEFQVESYLSTKELNHQSVSLVIPRLTRDRIHNAMYYKVNLHTVALRGDTMTSLSRVIIRDLGTLKNRTINQTHILGGVEFKCILMKLVEIRPSWDQMSSIFDTTGHTNFDNKYIIALLLTYLRIQYYFLEDDEIQAKHIKSLFKKYINDYRKLKSVSMDMDCWSMSQSVVVSIAHMDELVDWLSTKDEIWGIPLGRCQWCKIFDEDESSSDSDSESESESENSN